MVYTARDSDGKIKKHEIPSNFILWSTGIAMNPFTEKVTTYLPNQVHKKAIQVDAYLRVKGAPRGELYAVGDCATVRLSFAPSKKKQKLQTHFQRLKHHSWTISWNWWMKLTRIKTAKST